MGKFRKKSIFYKILFSYLLFFLIFILSNFAFYRIYSNHLQEEIRSGSYVLLQKTQQEIEDRLSSAKKVLEKVYMDDSFQVSVWQDSQEGIGMMSQYNLKKALNKWHTQDLADLFVYYEHSKRVVSSVYTSTDVQNYFSAYYAPNTFTTDTSGFEIWRTGIEAGSGALICREVSPGTNTIFISMNYPSYHTTNAKAIIAAVLRPAVISDALQGLQKGSLYVYNNEEQLLAASGTMIPGFKVSAEMGSYYTDTVNGKKLVIQVSRSEESGFLYVHVIPESVFWNKQREYLNTVLLFMGLFFLVSAAMIIWLSRANYQPWRRLVDTVQHSGTSMASSCEKAENELIQEAFHITLQQRQDYYDRIQSGKANEAENLLLRYLRSESGGEEFFRLVKEEALFPIEGAFALAEYHIESWDQGRITDLGTADTSAVIKQSIADLLDSASNPHMKGSMIVPWDRRSFFVLLSLDTDVLSVQLLEESVSQIAAILEKSGGISSTVLLSDVDNEKTRLPELFRQIQECEKYRSVFGREGLIQYHRISFRKFGYQGNKEYFKNYIWDWLKRDKETTNEFDVLRRLIDESISEKDADAESFLLFQKDLSKVLIQLSSELGISSSTWTEYFKTLACSSSWMEYKLYAAKCLKLFIKFSEITREEKDLINQAAVYIEENFHNADLNLNYISEHFHVSAQHLSRCFRERYQVSIIDYIAQVRVAHAKEALELGMDNIETIALNTGFLSSASFIRTFKKLIGMTPGAYREHYRL
ncbi:helix-turn-helix transcriptional regulator [Eisenbergiella sp.]|nr:AraC family transcriptional regulator [Eisenbergiella sp.]